MSLWESTSKKRDNLSKLKMKSSAIAHSNIALIKYWGRSSQHDPNLNIPLNDTVSMTKYGLTNGARLKTHTTIEFSPDYIENIAIVNGKPLQERGLERVHRVIDYLKKYSGIDYKFKMMSENDFPTQAGLASSASAFAALAIAAVDALGLKFSKEQLSTIARLGSGSASRSIHGGFVYCYQGNSHDTSYAEQICDPDCFQMNAVIAVVDEQEKKVTSDVGHQLVATSPFNEIRIQKSQAQAKEIRQAILDDDFAKVGQIAEENCKYMHFVMMTSHPPLFYWNPTTFRVIKSIMQFRDEGLECYFTIDAGPNVHCLCRPEDRLEIEERLLEIEGVNRIISAKPANDSYVTNEHLF